MSTFILQLQLFVYSNYLFALANFFLDTSTAPTEASPNVVRIKAKFMSEVCGFASLLEVSALISTSFK